MSCHWEVLNGVGVDGVGVILPFFYAFFAFFRFLSFFSLFFVFRRFSFLLLKDEGKQQQFTAKMGNFTPTPSAPTPCKTSRCQKERKCAMAPVQFYDDLGQRKCRICSWWISQLACPYQRLGRTKKNLRREQTLGRKTPVKCFTDHRERPKRDDDN